MPCEPQYPMYLISVRDLLELPALRPHQELKRTGKLQVWTEEMAGRVIFVSHEWLGDHHPDPSGEQFAVFQRTLKRLMSGGVRQVERCWVDQVGLQSNEVLESKALKSALGDMFVWFDYMSVPQPKASSARGAAEEGQPSTRNGAGSDHRLVSSMHSVSAKLVQDLQLAVASIPAYIARSDLLFVLAPGCLHRDRGTACNYSTWRSRGWCRLELQAAHLSMGDMPVMVCADPEADPFLQSKWEALQLPVGEGQFTCCRLGHKRFDGGDDSELMPCDRLQVRAVLEEVLDAKLQHLEETGQASRRRWLMSVRSKCLSGLPEAPTMRQPQADAEAGSGCAAPQSPQSPVSRLREAMRWTPEDDAVGRSTGRSLLLYACLSDNLEAVQSLLAGDCSAEVGMELRSPELEFGEYPMTPLLAATALARFEIVEALLLARADPEQRSTNSKAFTDCDALMTAASWGRADNVGHWLRRFPAWDLERRESIGGCTVLQVAVLKGCHDAKILAVVQTLLEARADPMTRAFPGGSVLISNCTSDHSHPEVLRCLLEARADVNGQMLPTKRVWKTVLFVSRAASRLGSQNQLFKEFSHWAGSTPLMTAARRGKLTEVQMLLDARADPLLRDQRGNTAMDVAQRCCLAPLHSAIGV